MDQKKLQALAEELAKDLETKGFQVALQLLGRGHSVRVMSRSKSSKIDTLIKQGADNP